MPEYNVLSKGRGSAARALSKAQRFLSSLKKWWWVLVVSAGVGASLAAWNDSKKAPSYISTGRMMVSGRIAMPEGAVYSEELQNFMGTQAALMQSSQVRQRASARLDTLHPELQPSNVALNVAQQVGTSFFELTAIGDNADYTRAFLDACMDEYIRFKRELRVDNTDTALTAITDELLKHDKDVENFQEELLAFQQSTNVVFIEEEGNSAAKYLAQLNQRLAALRTEYQLLSALTVDQNIERKASGSGPHDATSESSSAVMGAEAEYLKATQDLQSLRAQKDRHSKFMRPKHPTMIRLDAMISQQEKLIDLFRQQSSAQMANRRDSIKLEIDNLESSVKDWSAKAMELTRRIAEHTRLKSKVESAMRLRDSLAKQIQTVDMTKSLTPDIVTVMEKATQPQATKLGFAKDLAVGAISGLVVGMGILFLTMLLDDRIVSADELRERFQEELLGQIPREVSKARLNILTLTEKQHVFAESYRNLRSTLHFMSFEEPRPKTFLITSAVPGEGKSTVAANLAITIAGGGSKTLLIDADLRKGVAHEYFSLESSPGLSSVLTEQIQWRDAVLATCVSNLSLLPRGVVVAGTSEHFLSRVMDRLLQEVYPEYDCVIFDSAPVLANDDTASLAPKIDACLTVVRAGVSSARLTESALDALKKRQVNVLGLILNAADGRSAEYYYYHRYGEYYSQPLPQEQAEKLT